MALGILPNPVIKTPGEHEGRGTRLGYFEDSAIDQIKQVQKLKKEGFTMAQITRQLTKESTSLVSSQVNPATTFSQEAAPSISSNAEQGSPGKLSLAQNLSFDGSVDDLPGPAYMVNNNFELIWWNSEAQHSFFNDNSELPGDLVSRNLLKLLFHTQAGQDKDPIKDLLQPHLAAGKNDSPNKP